MKSNQKYKKNKDPYESEKIMGKSRGKMPPPSRALDERSNRRKRPNKRDLLNSEDYL